MAGASVVATGRWNSGNLRRGAEQDLNYLQRQANGFSKSVMGSFTGIGAAMGGIFAARAIVDFFKESAQAAMEDEAAMASLAKTMENVGQGFRTSGIEDFIGKMQMATGVADTDLRNAFQKIVTVTKDASEAQRLLSLAMDVSAGSGKGLEEVSAALAKAAGGQTTALQRLGVGLDAATLKSKDMGAITDALSAKFAGQAAVAADTYQGQMKRLSTAVDEAKEKVGYSLLRAVDNVSKAMGGTGGMQQSILEVGNGISYLVDGLGDLVAGLMNVTAATKESTQADKYSSDTLKGLVQLIPVVGSYLVILLDNQEGNARAAGELSDALAVQTARWVGLAGAASAAASAMSASNVRKANAAATSRWNAIAGQYGKDVKSSFFRNQDQYVKDYFAALKDDMDNVGPAGVNAASGVDKLTKAQEAAQQRAQKLAQDVDGLATSLQGLASDVAGGPVIDLLNPTFEAINSLVDKFKSSLSEARSYAQGIVDGFMGQLDLGKALDDAKATGGSIIEAFVAQGDKVVAFGNKLNALVQQGLSRAAFDDIMRLGYARGTEVADALANGNVAQNIANVNKVYGSVQTMAEQVAEAAKTAFYQAGLDLILSTVRAMVESLGVAGKGRRQLMSLMDDLAAAMSRNATITVGVVTTGGGSSATPAVLAPAPASASLDDWFSSTYPGVPTSSSTGNFYGGIATFAEGGIAMSATPGIFGEAGPEALIPLDRMGDFGGNTYSITVNAGVGDPRAIGKSVVEAITLFERSSGPVFARA